MGVVVLYPYQITDNKQQAVENLQKRLASFGAVQNGQFLVDCETYFSEPRNGPAKGVHVLHNSEYPTSTFSILDTSGGNKVPLVADNLFNLLMLKMTPMFSSKKPTKFESKGPRYEYGDFIIKLGSVTLMENFKGILIEIEYQPCVVLSYCWEMIREMLSIIVDSHVPAEYSGLSSVGQQQVHAKHNDIFEPIDTMHQYVEHFTTYRKQSMGASVSSPAMQINSNIRT